MEVQAYTTPESRRTLRNYLRQRRLTTSLHQTITMQTLNDLEEALRLLQGIKASPEWPHDEIAAFLRLRLQMSHASAAGLPLDKGQPQGS